MPATCATPKEKLVASNTESQSTATPKTVYLSIANGGYVLALKENGRSIELISENVGDRGDEQKWAIEYGDEPSSIALRNVANGKYMCCEAKRYGKVTTGDKQWWKMSVMKYTPPGACQLCPLPSTDDGFMLKGSGSAVSKGGKGLSPSISEFFVSVCFMHGWKSHR
jgi:hypothetical protein